MYKSIWKCWNWNTKTEEKPVATEEVSEEAPEEKTVVAEEVPEEKAVVTEEATEEKPVATEEVAEEKPVATEEVAEEKPVEASSEVIKPNVAPTKLPSVIQPPVTKGGYSKRKANHSRKIRSHR